MSGWLKRITGHARRHEPPVVVGLALGGGGVRGLAHIGVLRVLERAGVPIHLIAGTSMGAIVAGAYGLNPAALQDPITPDILNLGIPTPPRADVAPGDKESLLDRVREFIDTERFLIDTLWGWGVVPAEPVTEFLNRLTLGRNLEESRIPIAAVAIDLLSGERVIFRQGPATLALQASSAIPGFFPPVRHQGRLLADGAFVDVVPADVAREMGAQKVIAVDVDQEEFRVEVRNGLEAFLRAVELCSRHHKRHHLEHADLVIRPRFGRPIFGLDFSKAEHCLQAGIAAAEEALPQVKALVES